MPHYKTKTLLSLFQKSYNAGWNRGLWTGLGMAALIAANGWMAWEILNK
jgi:hypothetical protein